MKRLGTLRSYRFQFRAFIPTSESYFEDHMPILAAGDVEDIWVCVLICKPRRPRRMCRG